MNKPSIEEYKEAKQEYALFSSWLQSSNAKKNELIDALITERQNERTYLEQANKYKEIILAYEIYEEIEKKSKEG